MPKHLFFITSINEAKITISRIEKLKTESQHFSAVSSDPNASIFLKARGVNFSDVGGYYPNSRHVKLAISNLKSLIKKWRSDKLISDSLLYKNKFQLNSLIGYSLFTYLAEAIHGLMTAEEILKQINPDIIHISSNWSESPYRRYQSENLNLEKTAILQLAKARHLKIVAFSAPLPQTMVFYTLNFAFHLLWQSFRISYHQLFQKGKHIKPNNLTILANYYQLNNFIPIIKELKKQKQHFQVIGKISTDEIHKMGSISPIFTSLESLEKQNKNIKDIRISRVIKFTLRLITLKPRLERFFYVNNKYIWQYMLPKLIYYFSNEFPLLTDYLDSAKYLFKKSGLLITPATADTVSQTIVAVARSEKITVLESQHGFIYNEDDDRQFRKNDYFAVWGKEVRSIITKNQRPKQIPIIGYPHFDRYKHYHKTKIGKSSVREKLVISKNTKVLLILSVFPSGITRLSPNESPFQFMEIIFNTIIGLNEKWKIIFRPHPSVDASWVIPLAKSMEIDLFYDHRKFKLEEVIAASDVIISNPSTTMIESMFQRKPILLYDFPITNGAYKYSDWFVVSSGAIKLFKTQKQLKKLMLSSLYNQQFKKDMLNQQKLFLEEYCSFNLKPATERALSLINKLEVQ